MCSTPTTRQRRPKKKNTIFSLISVLARWRFTSACRHRRRRRRRRRRDCHTACVCVMQFFVFFLFSMQIRQMHFIGRFSFHSAVISAVFFLFSIHLGLNFFPRSLKQLRDSLFQVWIFPNGDDGAVDYVFNIRKMMCEKYRCQSTSEKSFRVEKKPKEKSNRGSAVHSIFFFFRFVFNSSSAFSSPRH